MNRETVRNIIREEAEDCGVKYKITKDNSVHFYGLMPQSGKRGWYRVSGDADRLAKSILERQRRALLGLRDAMSNWEWA